MESNIKVMLKSKLKAEVSKKTSVMPLSKVSKLSILSTVSTVSNLFSNSVNSNAFLFQWWH
ncbi:hypothetical protein J2127_000738 [Methanococcus voltae]|uniref:hypothetical protein n=1 Tax=Methanococcus voltae TaxID=2188 RepID=UPI001AE2E373|nr:hypothetical protein [Methanococcus voltae]MBP2143583.1 hypothetical protein [Methanococcus voltae]